jgi:uridylate cyclase
VGDRNRAALEGIRHVSFKDDLKSEVHAIFHALWGEPEKAVKVPAPEDIRLNQNHAKLLSDAVVLYADLDGSTNMVDNEKWWFAAEMYKAYLRCAAQIIRRNNGDITAYDGDRVMAVFYEGNKNTNAAITALELNYAVEEIIRPECKARYPDTSFVMKHVVGIAQSDLYAIRIGVRDDNDLTWVGKAANHAAKLCSISERPLWITEAVYKSMRDNAKYADGKPTGKNMWEARTWTSMNSARIYCSTYRMPF